MFVLFFLMEINANLGLSCQKELLDVALHNHYVKRVVRSAPYTKREKLFRRKCKAEVYVCSSFFSSLIYNGIIHFLSKINF